MNVGKLTQVIGSVFDVKLRREQVPALYNALQITFDFQGKPKTLYGEVQQHLGGGRVRAVSLGGTLGLLGAAWTSPIPAAPSPSAWAPRRSGGS